MKRVLVIFMIVFILVGLVACKAKEGYHYVSPLTQDTEKIPEKDDTVVEKPPVTEVLPVDQKPLVTVTLPVNTVIEKAEDGTELLRYTYQNMFLILPDSDVGNDVIVDFLNKRDQADANAATLSESAKEAYKPGTAWTPYVYQTIYEPMRIDNGILSLFGRNTVFSGSSHPETNYLSVSYDLVTGEVLTLEKIISTQTTADAITDLIVAVLNKTAAEKQLYDGYESTIADRFSHDFRHDTDWYFSDTGLTFFFSPYEIAPYSVGVISATIPYELLVGILDDAYFPAEKETSAGTLFGQLFTDEAASQYTQFAEVVLNPNGDTILLYTDHYVQNVRIVSGSWSADGSTFTPENTVFVAEGLTKDDAVMLQATLEPAAPTLQVSYTTGDQAVTAYISGTPGTSVTLK